MGKYDGILSSLTTGEVIARLEGHGGLLALSNRELFYIDDKGHQHSRLSGIKRITINKETGLVDVIGDHSTLMQISPSAFQKDELKLFLESLKGHVLKAKSEPTLVKEPAPAKEPSLETPLAPVEPPPPISLASREEPLPAPTPIPDLPPAAPVREAAPMPAPEPELELNTPVNIVEPPRTLPDEPADSLWSYEGAPKAAKNPTREETLRTQPGMVPANPSQDDLTLPLPPVKAAPSGRTGFFLLKVTSLLTLVYAVAYLILNLGSPAGATDPMIPIGVLIGGAALALIQWRLSEPL